MKQEQFPFLCSLPGGFIKNSEPASTVIEALRRAIRSCPYTDEDIASFVGMDKGNFNKFMNNSTKSVDAISLIIKYTRDLSPLITLAKDVNQEVHTIGTVAKLQEENQKLKEELQQIRSVISGAMNEVV